MCTTCNTNLGTINACLENGDTGKPVKLFQKKKKKSKRRLETYQVKINHFFYSINHIISIYEKKKKKEDWFKISIFKKKKKQNL